MSSKSAKYTKIHFRQLKIHILLCKCTTDPPQSDHAASSGHGNFDLEGHFQGHFACNTSESGYKS